jgi:exodeoxyribonuclease VII large subunit
MPNSYTLFELNEYIRRVIALNFAEPIWVNCEISQVKEVRGNVYLDLVYHDEKTDEVTAQISASIWFKSYLFLKNKLGALLPSLLKEGTHVLMKVQVEFNERYGMKLIIEDIDPSFTIGQMEMNRQKILQKLQDESLLHINKMTQLTSVIQNVAVISSHNAAGYIDFINHLTKNPYGYQYNTELFQVALQGQNTEREVCQALIEIAERKHDFDAILIMRGGGSKLDLAWFDSFNIGARIAKSPLPVITGIGHDIDSTVADLVAYNSLKTPTAVADFLINHNSSFESKIQETVQWIVQMAHRYIKNHELSLQNTTQMLQIIPAEIIKKHLFNIQFTQDQILMNAKNILRNHKEKLSFADQQMTLLHPKNILQKGYAIVRQDQKNISRNKMIKKNVPLTIEFFDGEIQVMQKV